MLSSSRHQHHQKHGVYSKEDSIARQQGAKEQKQTNKLALKEKLVAVARGSRRG